MTKCNEVGYKLLPCPQYFPDLVLNEYFLYPILKKLLSAKRFVSYDEVNAYFDRSPLFFGRCQKVGESLNDMYQPLSEQRWEIRYFIIHSKSYTRWPTPVHHLLLFKYIVENVDTNLIRISTLQMIYIEEASLEDLGVKVPPIHHTHQIWHHLTTFYPQKYDYHMEMGLLLKMTQYVSRFSFITSTKV